MTVKHEDVLKMRHLPQLLKTFQPMHGRKIGVVANIPYNITSGAYTLGALGYKKYLLTLIHLSARK